LTVKTPHGNFALTMPASSQPILIFIFALASVPILLGIRRRRESIARRIRGLIILEGTYLGVAFIMLGTGFQPLESMLAGVVAAFIVMNYMKPRKRHIPTHVKRKARAKFELKTGTKYNPRKHEFDHEVPFSRGGSHTADNIRVVEKKANRSKGTASPWWDVLGKF
jgi:hypothetical protein